MKTLPFCQMLSGRQLEIASPIVLSKREYQVTSLFVKNLSRQQIAEQLSINPAAVSCYLYTALKKLKIQKSQLSQLFISTPPKFKDWLYKEKIQLLSLPTSASIAAEKLDCSYMTAYRLLKQNNLLLRQERISINWNGRDYSLNELSKLTGIKYETLYWRICLHKWSVDEAIQGKRKKAEKPVFVPKAKKITELYSQGIKRRVISERLGVSYEYVCSVISKYNKKATFSP